MAKKKRKKRIDLAEYGVYVKPLRPRMLGVINGYEGGDQTSHMAAWAAYCTYRASDDEPYWESVDACLDDDEGGLVMFQQCAEAALRVNGFLDGDPVEDAAKN